MISFIRRLIQYLTRKREIPFLLKLDFTPNVDYFEKIYERKLFGKSQSASGPGSTLVSTARIREHLENLMDEFQISSLVDVPCGDFYWMSKVDLDKIDYIGLDIVPSLINKLQSDYPRMTFGVLDVTKDQLQKYDLILCRDLFVHLSNDQIISALNNFRNSGSKYLLATTFPDVSSNSELRVPRIGVGWRPLNLTIHPFNLGAPILTINEESTEGRGKYRDKSISLWKLN